MSKVFNGKQFSTKKKKDLYQEFSLKKQLNVEYFQQKNPTKINLRHCKINQQKISEKNGNSREKNIAYWSLLRLSPLL